MTQMMTHEVVYDHVFDPETKRHYLNGTLTVLHCHHYLTLYTQLAIDAGETALLQESARESFKKMLARYFDMHLEGAPLDEKLDTACEYYSLLGLGKMKPVFIGDDSGEVELTASHTDSGWMKKWGEYDKPVNYVTAGYIEAMFEVLLNAPEKAFSATEVESIVMGADSSKFRIIRR
jgi:predicted hydrocarbon binding protein